MCHKIKGMKEKKPHSTPPDIPGLPQTWDELMDCVKEGEEEFERGEAIPWDVATSRLKKHIADYVA